MSEHEDFRYLPFVDGLRAVAVLMVIAFHAGLGIRGGYVGVDIFFVISGFLITGLISRDLNNHTWSLKSFWLRRVRRILPAAICVTVVTLIVSAIVLLPDDFAELGLSAAAQQWMLSNVFFWRHVGYFSPSAELKPLLHFWSLAVEEQFYVVYPILLLTLHQRWQRSRRFAVLVVLIIMSLSLSEWGIRQRNGGSFFLLPSRGWELLLGGLAWYIPVWADNRQLRTFFSLFAFASIGVVGLFYSSSTRFPGLAALWPCLAAAVMIHCCRIEVVHGLKWLESQPIVFVGRLSYSLYLWHWPVLVLLRHTPGINPDSVAVKVAALVVIFLLAWLTWLLVEQPIRSRKVFPGTRSMLGATGIAMMLLTSLGLLISASGGWPSRFERQVLQYAEASESFAFRHEVRLRELEGRQLPEFGRSNGRSKCLIWGDSHAMALVPGLNASCQRASVRGYQVTHSETPPLLDFTWTSDYGLNEDGPEFTSAVVEFADTHQVDVVILAAMWAKYQHSPAFRDSLLQTVSKLSEHGIQVAIVRDVAAQENSVPLMLTRAVRTNADVTRIGVDVGVHLDRLKPFNEAVEALTRNVIILDPSTYLVDETGLWRAEFDGVSMYRDADHLSIEGSMTLQPMFDELFNAATSRNQR